MSENFFLLYIFIPAITWLLLVIALIVLLLKKYTFGKWTKDKPNPYTNEVLGCPPGTLRAILALSTLVFAIIIQVASMQYPFLSKTQSQFMLALQIVLSLYFFSKILELIIRNRKKQNEANSKTQSNNNQHYNQISKQTSTKNNLFAQEGSEG